MGGHWAVWLSQQSDLPIRSAVLYYAARGGSVANSKVSFPAHFADVDLWVRTTARRRMERAIVAADRPYAAYDYPGTGHWFAESAREHDYNPESAKSAFDRTLAHLKAVNA